MTTKSKSSVSFRAPTTAPAAPIAAAPITTVPVTTREELPAVISEAPFIDITGDVDGSDVTHTRLAVKHQIDTRFDTVLPGNLVAYLGEEHYSITPPVKVIALTLDKFFLQVTEQGETPVIAKSEVELEEAGGTLKMNDPELLPFRPAADILFLVAGLDPKKFDGIPFLDALGIPFAPMKFRGKNSAYEPTAKVLISWQAIKHSRGEHTPMCDFPYDLVVLKSPWKGTTFFKPSLRRRREEPHSPAQIAAFVEIAKNF
jgi:hypothetical protein